MEHSVFSLKYELSLCMSCIFITVFKQLKVVEHDSLDLNECHFMNKDSEKNLFDIINLHVHTFLK